MTASNRATSKPVSQHGDRTAVEAQALAAKKAEDAKLAAQTRAPKPAPPAPVFGEDIDLHFSAKRVRGESLVVIVKHGES